MKVAEMLKVLESIDLKSGSIEDIRKLTEVIESFHDDVCEIFHENDFLEVVVVNQLIGQSVQATFRLRNGAKKVREYEVCGGVIKSLKLSWHSSLSENLQHVTLSIYFDSDEISHLEMKKLANEQVAKLVVFVDRQQNLKEVVDSFYIEFV